jgi:hypothetical protein
MRAAAFSWQAPLLGADGRDADHHTPSRNASSKCAPAQEIFLAGRDLL